MNAAQTTRQRIARESWNIGNQGRQPGRRPKKRPKTSERCIQVLRQIANGGNDIDSPVRQDERTNARRYHLVIPMKWQLRFYMMTLIIYSVVSGLAINSWIDKSFPAAQPAHMIDASVLIEKLIKMTPKELSEQRV